MLVKNKKCLMGLLCLLVLTFVSVGIFFSNHNGEIPVGEIKYKLLNDQYNSDAIRDWVKENEDYQGLYTRVIDGKTYVMFTYGKQTVDGYGFKGIKLTKTENNGIVLSVELTEPINHDEIRTPYSPKLILEINQIINESINFNGAKR